MMTEILHTKKQELGLNKQNDITLSRAIFLPLLNNTY